jgi:putative ABC transport system permease protein
MRLGEIGQRLGEFVRARRVDRDLGEEVESHLALLADDYQRRGWSPAAARAAARRDFGGVDQVKERVRDRRGIPMIERLSRDIHHAVRQLRKARAFTVVAVLTLALGIGVNTAIFSVIDAVMLRPLPFADPGRLVSLWEGRIGQETSTTVSSGFLMGGGLDPGRMSVAPANFVAYQARAAGFVGMAGFDRVSVTLTGVGAPEQLAGESVTPNYFDLLGAVPALGRLPNASDGRPGAAPVVVLAHAFWKSRFGGDPGVVGRLITLNGQGVEVIAVMRPAFQAVSELGKAPVPCPLWVLAVYSPELLASHGDHEINVVGRLAPGTSVEAAQRAVTAVSEQLAAAYPAANEKVRAFVRPLQDDLTETVRPSLVALVVMVGLVLLIACVNVANLFIVRGAGRRREVAIRYALGASRGRVMAEMLTQALVLSLAGSVLGLLFGYWTKDSLIALAPGTVPRLNAVSLDGRVVALAGALALGTGVVFGLLPAWQARRARPIDALKNTTGAERSGAGAWTMRWRNALMVAELALSTILVVGAALAARSLLAINRVDVGFRTDHVLALNVILPDSRYPTGDARYAFFAKLETALRAIPGVSSVAFANRLPLRGGWGSGVQIDGVDLPGGFATVDFQAVNPGYFDTLGLRLLGGRLLTEADVKGSEPVAVVSERFSAEFLHGTDALGVRMRRAPSAPWITIVGTIADIRRDGRRAEVTAQAYLPAAQTTIYPVHLSDVALLIGSDPSAFTAPVQQAVWAVDKDQPITNIRTLDETMAIGSKDQRFQTSLFGLFAALAVVLALVGLHGVVSYAVAQRTPEIGLRMALGADGRSILFWLMREAALLVALGAALGVLGAIGLSHFLSTLLFKVTPTDPPTYAAAVGALGLVALGASFLAARRATLIDPVRALRQD